MLGRCRDRSHHRIDHRGDIIPRVALDYMFFTDYGITMTLEEARELIEQHPRLQQLDSENKRIYEHRKVSPLKVRTSKIF